MKRYFIELFYLLLCFITISSCKKDVGTQNDIFNPNPSTADSFNTTMILQVHDNSTLALSNVPDLFYKNKMFDLYSYKSYIFKNVICNKLSNSITTNFSSNWYIDNVNSIPFLPATVNFANIGVWEVFIRGVFDTRTRDSLSLDNGGMLYYPDSCFKLSFGNTSISTDAKTVYPGDNEFYSYNPAPCLAKTYSSNKNQYLKSYGLLLFNANASTPVAVNPLKLIQAKMPIATTLVSTAPDSIPVWKFKYGGWNQYGFAKKNGNFYECNLDEVTDWNFAVPENGYFKKIKIITDSSQLPFVNATITFRDDNQNILSEIQTNSNGEAYCFLPERQNVKLTVYSPLDILNRSEIYTTVIPVLNANTPDEIKIPENLAGTYKFYNECSVIINQGYIIINGYQTNVILPIVNGYINSASVAMPVLGNTTYSLYDINGIKWSNNFNKMTLTEVGNVGHKRILINTCP